MSDPAKSPSPFDMLVEQIRVETGMIALMKMSALRTFSSLSSISSLSSYSYISSIAT
jgi:hypothetical protein